MSTPSVEAEPQVVDVLRGERRGRQRDARAALMPLCSPSGPPSTTRGLRLVAVASPRPAARCGRRRAAADRPVAPRAPDLRRWSRRGPARPSSSPVTISSVSPRPACSGPPPSSRPVRIFGPLRSCRIATWRPARRRRAAYAARCSSAWSRVRAVREVQPEDVGARRRSARRSAHRSDDAGPSVAMILVRRFTVRIG